jgi:hypothetical protein
MSETTTETAQAATAQTVLYHWMMTLQSADGRQATIDGTQPVIEGVHTREQVYAALFPQVKEHFGLGNVGCVCLFFSLERNVLGGGR